MRPDFVVRYDPENETSEELSKKIFYSVFIRNKLKARKPINMFMGGDSGEGKSWTDLRLAEVLLEIQGIDAKEVINDINVYTPLEYPDKLNALLFPKETTKDNERQKILKKTNILILHEAREVVKAKNWRSFINIAIADVNAMSRSIKRLCTIITSQFIRDISTDIRYTLNFYCTVRRPPGRRARLYLNVLWKDDTDLEKPRLRRRRLRGFIVLPNGRYRRYIPQYFEMNRPSEEIIKIFEKQDFDAKAVIIRNKLEKLMKEMRIDCEDGKKKLKAMVEWYAGNLENLQMIGKRVRNRFKLKEEVKDMHDLTREEVKEFQEMLNIRLMQKGVVEDSKQIMSKGNKEKEEEIIPKDDD